MRTGHNWAERSTVPHGEVTSLFPVDELACSVLQNRDAQLQLEQLESRSVLTVTPDGMASGYFLAQHPLTLVPVAELPDDQREAIEATLDDPLSTYRYVRLGRTVASGQNRSLAEFKS
ncbi:hypothetical protein [Haloarcula sp. CBA1127]|uniref:hypothetical protein n=1 Tax=Haloarcula sp. CBA1127 TaxID=1765055 RepID=UPI00073F5D57|nr:hypothetical protein [Haloarcula sp. CBA1127]